jgi:hypothetical protein
MQQSGWFQLSTHPHQKSNFHHIIPNMNKYGGKNIEKC